jgi:hypothetical protein
MNRSKEMLKGAMACREGCPCDPNQTPKFKRGYAEQYELDQRNDHKTVEQAKQMGDKV